jgi:1,4-dihydroxy-2-naphthoyl-CoA synthase
MGMRLYLIDNWHHAWRWSSIRFIALGGVTQMALQTMPDRVLAFVPGWALQGLSMFSLACILAAGLGRITTTEKPVCPSSPPPSQ